MYIGTGPLLRPGTLQGNNRNKLFTTPSFCIVVFVDCPINLYIKKATGESRWPFIGIIQSTIRFYYAFFLEIRIIATIATAATATSTMMITVEPLLSLLPLPLG